MDSLVINTNKVGKYATVKIGEGPRLLVLVRGVHGSGRIGFGPKPNSTRLDRVTEFQIRIQSNIRVRSDISDNWSSGSESLV